MNTDNSEKAKELLRVARQLLKDDKYQEALEALNKAIELEPGNAVAWQGKGVALFSLKRYPEALEAYTKAVEMNPSDASLWWGKGVALFSLKRYPEALEAFAKAIELEPGNARAWRGTAEALYHLNLSSNDALEAIDKALLYEKGNASFLNTKGVILIRLGQYEEAIKLFEEAFRINSNHLFMFNKAVALVRLSRCDEAKEALQRAIEVTPGTDARRKEYRKHLDTLINRERPVIWTTWWFGESCRGGWIKRCLGGFLLILLIFYLVIPLVTFNTDLLEQQGRLWWISLGKDWQAYIIPVAALVILLLSPTLRGLGTQGLELSPILPSLEVTVKDIAEKMQPKFE